MAKSKSFWTRHLAAIDRRWLWAGLILGVAQFIFFAALPALYRGRGCNIYVDCDAEEYIRIAQQMTGLGDVFRYLHNRIYGYPLFLYAHRVVFGSWTLSGGRDWVDVSLLSSFVFHAVASIIFVRDFGRAGWPIPRWAIVVLLAHPLIVSHLAAPLTDVFAMDWLMLGLALTLRSGAWLFGAGACLGMVVASRPSYLGPIVLAVAATAVVEFYRKRGRSATRERQAMLVGVVLISIGAGAVLFPRVVACRGAYGELCLQSPSYSQWLAWDSVVRGMRGIRDYGVFDGKGPGWEVLVPDSWVDAHYNQVCAIPREGVIGGLIRCHLRTLPYLPLYLAKKTVGFFDHPYLGPYSILITTQWQAWGYRVLGLGALLGTLMFFVAFFTSFRGRKPSVPGGRLAGLAAFTYFGVSLLLCVVPRYHMALLPFACVGWQAAADRWGAWNIRARGVVAVMVLLISSGYFYQTVLWDVSDPSARASFVKEINSR